MSKQIQSLKAPDFSRDSAQKRFGNGLKDHELKTLCWNEYQFDVECMRSNKHGIEIVLRSIQPIGSLFREFRIVILPWSARWKQVYKPETKFCVYELESIPLA